MKFKLDFQIQPLSQKIGINEKIILLGSCFSDDMSMHFKESGLNVLSNPFGTIFHPQPIAEQIKLALDSSSYVRLIERDGVFLDWLSGARIYGKSSEELKDVILAKREELRTFLTGDSTLVITFGTAWGYRLNCNGDIVGNCHKQAQQEFTKELSEVNGMFDDWKSLIDQLKHYNPALKIIFTISPVRHIKDGLIENNRSKARLIELIHRLTAECGTSYFPSYEILIDELRDYRFYAKDLVHPDAIAVEYIWTAFQGYAYSMGDITLLKKVHQLKMALNHRPIHEDSEAERKRRDKLKSELEEFRAEYPYLSI